MLNFQQVDKIIAMPYEEKIRGVRGESKATCLVCGRVAEMDPRDRYRRYCKTCYELKKERKS